MSIIEPTWPGVIDTRPLKPDYINAVNRLADMAKAGRWEPLFKLLESDTRLDPNRSRITGSSWFAPLHQAAWLGAPVEVVEELIARGAWRSLKNAAGDRPIDIARKRGKHHLLEVLDVAEIGEDQQQKFGAWDRHLAELIEERTRGMRPVKFRKISTEIIYLEDLDNLWFAYPGMYGGFSMSIRKNQLFVESWSRVVGGSGQAHVITESGCVLVERGFV